MHHIRGICRKAQEYGVRPVIHPHAGGYIEFADEIEKLVKDIPYPQLPSEVTVAAELW